MTNSLFTTSFITKPLRANKIKPCFYLACLLFFLGISATYSSSLLAQTKYVTDKITLEIHESASSTSMLIEQIPSGTALNVLETDGAFAKVETPDKKTGWVEAAYLMSDKPAQLLYAELANKHKQSLELIASLQDTASQDNSATPALSDEDEKNISGMRAELKKARDNATSLERTVSSSNKEYKIALEEKKQLEIQIAKLQSKLNETITENNENINELNSLSANSPKGDPFFDNTSGGALDIGIPLLWFLIGIAAFMALGIYAGMSMLDAQNRKRHGGFRI